MDQNAWDSRPRQAIEWLLSLKPDTLPTITSAERLKDAVTNVVAAIESGEYENLSGAEALIEYFDSLPDSICWPRPAVPLLKYGQPALLDRLFALATGPVSHNVSKESRSDLAEMECEAIDEWAIGLFEHCRKQPPAGLRMMAMLDQVEVAVGPWDRRRIGLRASFEANERLRAWQRFAARLAT